VILFVLLIYNLLVIPTSFFVFHIAIFFSKKIRSGYKGRLKSWKELIQFRENRPHRELYIIHSASLGEFEQAKPVIRGIKTLRPDVLIVASFTSPSGYENALRIAEVDLYIYLPLDTIFKTRRFIQKLRPSKIIFVTYELWPNLIINARRHNVTTYLISARIRKTSKKWIPVIKTMIAELYRSLDYIFAVSDEDKMALQKLIGTVDIKVLNLGDSRYDQVIQRAKNRIKNKIPKLFSNGFVFIGGSVWPQDVRRLLPPLIKLMREEDIRIILAPHEPNEYALEMLEDNFDQEKIDTCRLSQFQKSAPEKKVILVDKIGVLAELYHKSHLAFVGGSFRGSIHNVMEPAVAGIPVIFGPAFHNSREAELLIENGGGKCLETSETIYREIKILLHNNEKYEEMAKASKQVILKNLGAAAKTVKEILEND